MLLAVEGGGFFSSSASGYSKGLALIFFRKKTKENPMRVSPWNQYQLVVSDPDIQLDSEKNRLSRGCATFVCFGRASAGLEGPSSLKVGPAQPQVISTEPPVSDKGVDPVSCKENDKTTIPIDDDRIAIEVTLKSSLKKPSHSITVSVEEVKEAEALVEKCPDIPAHTEKRKLQWMDACGRELVEIREYEISDVESDDEFENGTERSCACAIM